MKSKSNSNLPAGNFGKLQPQALELEEAVLGALMIDKEAINTVIDILKPESFYKIANQEIYQAIYALFSKSEPVDILTVTQELRRMAKIDLVGGPAYIMRLTNTINSAANIETHARIITELAIKRDLISISSEIQRDAFEDSSDVFDLLDSAEQKLFQISESNIRKNYSSMGPLIAQAIREIEARKDLKDGLTGIPTGFTELDRVTAGWQKSDLIIIAARPAMGKTAFSLSMLRNAAVDFGFPAAIFSLEMSELQLVNRLISAEAELESEKIKRGNLERHEWEQLYRKTTKIGEAPIFIDDTPGLSILELRAKCRRLKAQYDIQLVIVDYLQLMTAGSGKNAPGNREQEIASISRALKNLAKELNIPVIALSQLSRAVETRGGDKRPQLSDLRESGSIEQDADIVMFLYRPEYYGITQDMEGNPTVGLGEVIIAKHRNGSLKDVKLKFIGKFTKFENLEADNFNFGGNNTVSDPAKKSMTFSSKANEPSNGQNNLNTFNNQQNQPRLDDEPPF
jgi:replicative DNA helicase